MNKNAIIIGATSGIGKALADVLLGEGYTVGIAGRRLDLLEDIQNQNPEKIFTQQMDVAQTEKAEKEFQDLIHKMGNIDLVIISAGIGHSNHDLDNALEMETIDINIKGFIAIANTAFLHFQKNGKGHLAGISSILCLRGNADAPAYNASKACVSNYMEGLRLKALKNKLDIPVTDIRPGFVDTPMAQGDDRMFWVAPPEKAARQIIDAVKAKKKRVYITKRWQLIAWLMRITPDVFYKNI